jgi:hydroxyquinol 1,2-dioxygenase
MNFTEDTATEAVLASFAGTPDPRLARLVGALVRHLHAFVREVEPTMAEWEEAVQFLTAVGQRSDDTRQEYVLLSDVLGVSMLVEAINARLAGGSRPDAGGAPADLDVTASTVLGPFHVVTSPPRPTGASLYPEDGDPVGGHPPCVVTGQVLDPDGTPLPGAIVDVWQCDADGHYDVQCPETQPVGNGRGLFRTDGDGRFWFRTVVPSYYPIPTDGPVGDLLRSTARHPFRPAHIHFIVRAEGHLPLTTHVFVADSPYIDSDAVFAVNQHLVQEFVEIDDPGQAAGFGVATPFRHAHAQLVVRPVPAELPA